MKRYLGILLVFALMLPTALPVAPALGEPAAPARIDLPGGKTYIAADPLPLSDGSLLIAQYESLSETDMRTMLYRYAADGSLLWSAEIQKGNIVSMTEQPGHTVEVAFFRVDGWNRCTRRYHLSDGSLAEEGPLFLPAYDQAAQASGVKPGMYLVTDLGGRFLRKERNPALGSKSPRYTYYQLETWDGSLLWRLETEKVNASNLPSVKGVLSVDGGTLFYGGRSVPKAGSKKNTTAPAAVLIGDAGDILWEYVMEGAPLKLFAQAIELADGNLLLTQSASREKVSGLAVKLDAKTGKLLWQNQLAEDKQTLGEERPLETPWGLLAAGENRKETACACWLMDENGQTLAAWETPYNESADVYIEGTIPFVWNGALWVETQWLMKGGDYLAALVPIPLPEGV